MASDLEKLSAEEFLLLTTFRRSGEAVGTPVWVVRDGDHLLVTTGDQTGKVKRIRHTPRVLLTPCSRRGKVSEDAHAFEATAEVVEDPVAAVHLQKLITAKYGFLAKLIVVVEKVLSRVKGTRRIALRLQLL